MKRILKDYFTFSKKERVAVIILLLLLSVFVTAPFFYSVKHPPPLVNKELQHYISQQSKVPEAENSTAESKAFVTATARENKPKPKLFYFDPNTISSEGWKQLGIRDKTIHTILNFRNKNGKFRTPEDIRKIWGLKKEEADAIIPYAQIAEPVSTHDLKINPTQNLTPSTVNKKQPHILDINSATIEEWQSLPGIGPVLANRIIKFREKIGGFQTVDQIQKTYGISDSVFKVIVPYLHLQTEVLAGKINVNKASAFDLSKKAGISASIARSIIVFREQNGPFRSVEDLKKMVFISDTLYARISRNLVVE